MITDPKSPFCLSPPVSKRADYEDDGTFLRMIDLYDSANEMSTSRDKHNLMMLAWEVDSLLVAAMHIDYSDSSSRAALSEAITVLDAVRMRLACWKDQALEQYEQAREYERRTKREAFDKLRATRTTNDPF